MPDFLGMKDDPDVWDEIERRAIDEHKKCLTYWSKLEQHDKWRHDHMTTKHGVEMHYRDHKGRDRLGHLD